jgi:hypothetical protein
MTRTPWQNLEKYDAKWWGGRGSVNAQIPSKHVNVVILYDWPTGVWVVICRASEGYEHLCGASRWLWQRLLDGSSGLFLSGAD